MTLDHMQIF